MLIVAIILKTMVTFIYVDIYIQTSPHLIMVDMLYYVVGLKYKCTVDVNCSCKSDVKLLFCFSYAAYLVSVFIGNLQRCTFLASSRNEWHCFQ